MKTIKQTKIKKTITAKVVASNGEMKIKYPRQTIQSLALLFDRKDREPLILKQWELVLSGDRLEIVVLK